MSETATEKVRRVTSEQLDSVSFSCIELKESSGEEVEEVEKEGGVMTQGITISFDVRYVLKASELALAFVMAHEHCHTWLEPSPDESDWKRWHRIDAMVRTGVADPQITSQEKFEKAAALFAAQESDWYADDYAIRRLFDSGWSLTQVKTAAMEWKSLQEWYVKETRKDPQDLIGDVEGTYQRLLRRCQEIWENRQLRLVMIKTTRASEARAPRPKT
jgi:hypothetical protein